MQSIDVVQAIAQFQSTDTEQLSLAIGDIVFVEKKDVSGWWKGTAGIRRGSSLFI